MKKKVISMVLIVAMLFTSFPAIGIKASAQDVYVGSRFKGGNSSSCFYTVLTQDSTTKTGTVSLFRKFYNPADYTGEDKTYFIEDSVEYGGYTYTVEEIYHNAFDGYVGTDVTIVIPASVKRIGNYAFENIKDVRFENPDTLELFFTTSFFSGSTIGVNIPSAEESFYTFPITNKKSGKSSTVSVEVVGYKNGKTNSESKFIPGQLLTAEVSGYENTEDLWYRFEVDSGDQLTYATADISSTESALYSTQGMSLYVLCKGEIYASLPYQWPYWSLIGSSADPKTLKIHVYEMQYDENGCPGLNELCNKTINVKNYNRKGVVKKESDAGNFLKQELTDNVLIVAAGESIALVDLLSRSGTTCMACNHTNLKNISLGSGSEQYVTLGSGSGSYVPVIAGNDEGLARVNYKCVTEGIPEAVVGLKKAQYEIYNTGIKAEVAGADPEDIDLSGYTFENIFLDGCWQHGTGSCSVSNYIYVAPKFEYDATYNSITFTDKTAMPGVTSTFSIDTSCETAVSDKTIKYSGLKANTTYHITQTVTVTVDGKTSTGKIVYEAKTKNGYPMYFDIVSDDAAWICDNVGICYEDGTTLSAMDVYSYDQTTGTRTYKAIIPCDEEDNLLNYRIKVDGVDVGVTMRQVSGEDHSSAEFYTARIALTQDGAPKTDAVVSVTGTSRSVGITDCTDNGVYKAHFLNDDSTYSVSVANVIDNNTYTVDRNNSSINIDYYSVNFYTSQSDETSGDVSYNTKLFRTYTIAGGQCMKTPPYPNLNGYTFSVYNETPFAEGEDKHQTGFDFDTPITGTKNLYAHFIKAAIEINEVVKCNADGTIDGTNGTSYYMPNLTVDGFSKGNVLQSARIAFTGNSLVKIPVIGGAEILTKDGSQPVIENGYYVFTYDNNVVFNLTDKMSCADMESFLRGIIVTPNASANSNMQVSVSDNVQSPYETQDSAQTAASFKWTYVTNTSVSFNNGGYYYFANNLSFTNVAINGTVTFYIPLGIRVSFYGTAANGQWGANPGINLTAGNTLIVLGSGELYAKGGDAANGTSGDPGGSGVIEESNKKYYGGNGGNGGAGGGGAGAGIGTAGGYGGSGGYGSYAATAPSDWNDNKDISPNTGGSGGSGGPSIGSFGTLYAAPSVTISAIGGSAGAGGAGGAAGNEARHYRKVDKEDKYYYAAAGGGGGGGGTGGGNTRAVGGGYYVVVSYGGGGGAGGNAGGTGGYNYSSSEMKQLYKSYAGGAGGSSSDYHEYCSAITTYMESNSVTFDASEVGGQITTAYYTPFNETGSAFTFPAYTAPTGLQFNGWRIVNYAQRVDGQGYRETVSSASETLYDAGATYTFSKLVYGSVCFEPSVECIKAKVASASHTVARTLFDTPVSYYTYTVHTTLDGEAKDLGKLTFENVADGTDSFGLNGTEAGVYTAILSRNAEYRILLNGEDSGVTVTAGTVADVAMKSMHVDITVNGEKEEGEHAVTLMADGNTYICSPVYYNEAFTGAYELYVFEKDAKESYAIYVDGEDAEKSVVPSGTQTVNLIRATVRFTGNSVVDTVRMFTDITGLDMETEENGEFTYTAVHESDVVYKVIVNGMDSGKTIMLNSKQNTVEVPFYTITVTVRRDGIPFDDSEFVPVYTEGYGQKTGVGIYEIYQFDTVSDVDVSGYIYTPADYAVYADFFTVTADSGIVNGTVDSNITIAAAGDEIFVENTPADNYTEDTLSVRTASGTPILNLTFESISETTEASEETEKTEEEEEETAVDTVNEKMFTMPAAPVVVGATFKMHEHIWTYRIKSGEENTVEACCLYSTCNESPAEVTINAEDYVYTGSPVDATVTGSIPGVATPAVVYYDADNNKMDAVPVDAGDYTATISYTGRSATCVEAAEIVTVTAVTSYTIIEADTVITEKPEALDLTYNANAQTLCTAGTAQNGTMYYVQNTDSETAPAGDTFVTSVPRQTNAGVYYVWFRSIGDKNYNDTAPEALRTEIKKRDPAVSDFSFAAPENLYHEHQRVLDEETGKYVTIDEPAIKAAVIEALPEIVGMGDFEIKYFSDPECKTEAVPGEVGTYYVGIEIAEGDNYNSAFLTDASWKFDIIFRPVTLTFDKNAPEATGIMAVQNMYAYCADFVALSANEFTNGEKEFRGWSLTPYGVPVYHDKDEVNNLEDSMSLYAIWADVIVKEDDKEEEGFLVIADEGVEPQYAEDNETIEEIIGEYPDESEKYNIRGVIDGMKEEYVDEIITDNTVDAHSQRIEIDINNQVKLENAEKKNDPETGLDKLVTLHYSVKPYVTTTTYVDGEAVLVNGPDEITNDRFALAREPFTVSLPCYGMTPLSVVHSELNEAGDEIIVDVLSGDDVAYNAEDDTINVTVTQFSDIRIFDEVIELPEAQLIRESLVIASGTLAEMMAIVQHNDTIRIRKNCSYDTTVYCYAPADFDGTPIEFRIDNNGFTVNAYYEEGNGYCLGNEPVDEQVTKYTIFTGCRNITYTAYQYMAIRLLSAVGVKDGFRMYSLNNTLIGDVNGFAATETYQQTECHVVRFAIEKLDGCTFDTVGVTIDGVRVEPDENGIYTVPKGETDVVVKTFGTIEKAEEEDLTLWEKIYRWIRAFFQYVVSWFRWGSNSASDSAGAASADLQNAAGNASADQ